MDGKYGFYSPCNLTLNGGNVCCSPESSTIFSLEESALGTTRPICKSPWEQGKIPVGLRDLWCYGRSPETLTARKRKIGETGWYDPFSIFCTMALSKCRVEFG